MGETTVNIIRASDIHLNFNAEHVLRQLQFNGISDEAELAAFAIKHTARRILPYGIWECSNGRKVIFNREYQPIFQQVNGVNSYTDRNEWVKDIIQTTYLFDDSNSPIDFLKNKYEQYKLTSSKKKACKKSLLICLAVLKEFTPKEHSSVNSACSVDSVLS